MSIFILVLFFLIQSNWINATQLTLILPSRSGQCFGDDLEINQAYSVSFQVVAGGNLDVNFFLLDPQENHIKFKLLTQREKFNLHAKFRGEYKLCFENNFSVLSTKLVYFKWLKEENADQLTDSQMNSTIHQELREAKDRVHTTMRNLDDALDNLIDVLLRDKINYDSVASLNSKVMYWSSFQSIVVVCVALAQTIFLRSLFRMKKPIASMGTST